jgi:hypothetical protein
MMKNVFRETPDGTGVVHTAVSRRLVEEPMLSHWMRFNLDENWKAAANELDALERWPHSDEPSQTVRKSFGCMVVSIYPGKRVLELAEREANSTERAMYEVLNDDPERGQRFAHAMSLHARNPLFAVDHLSSSYDWAALGSSTVVDMSTTKSGLNLGWSTRNRG